MARLVGDPEKAFGGRLTVGEREFPAEAIELPGWWQQLLGAQRREARRVLSELVVARGLMPQLMKVRNGGQWTPDERRELMLCLRRVARVSPYLLILLLPGSLLILPAYAWWLDRRRLTRQD